MISLTIDASGPIAALNVVSAKAGDFTEPTRRVLTSALMDAAENIESGGGIFGSWPGYSPFTFVVDVALKRTRSGTMLRQSGALLASLEPGGPGNILEAGPDGGQAGTSSPVASYQHFGTDSIFRVLQGEGYKSPGLPERPILGWREDRIPEYEQIFADHLFEGAGEA